MAKTNIFGERWEKVELPHIGEGGQGYIYKVKDLTGEYSYDCVLKVFKGIKRIDRINNEIKALQKLDHPQIVPILDFSITDKEAYFVTKQFSKHTLADLAPLAPLKALEIFVDICEPIVYAHSKGIVHRDLKPENIVFDDDKPVILDFGLCFFTDEEDNRLTATIEQIGSRYFIPPELERGKSENISEASDSYTLGKILYFSLTKKLIAREDFTGSNSLSVMLKNPQLDYITQRILEKSVTEHLDKRISVSDLQKEAETVRRLIYEHFHPNQLGSRCRFCGEGTYQTMVESLDGLKAWNYMQSSIVRDHEGKIISSSSYPSDFLLNCRAIACDTCGNIQWFRIKPNP